MDTSKQILEKEKREERAKDVIVRLCSSTMQGFSFNVYKDEETEKIKYIGTITEDHKGDDCTCQSFMHGNNENYQKTHPLPFQCKHIIAAHKMMEGFWK